VSTDGARRAVVMRTWASRQSPRIWIPAYAVMTFPLYIHSTWQSVQHA